MRATILFVCLFLCLSKCVESAKILGIFPTASFSHYALGARLLKELAAKGHEVTVLCPYAEKEKIKNYKIVELTGFKEEMKAIIKQMDMYEQSQNTRIYTIHELQLMGLDITEKTLNHPNTQKLLEMNEKYDVIIMEQFLNNALRGLCHHFNAPCIQFSTVGATGWVNGFVGNPNNPSYMPEMLLNFAGPMDFWRRLENTALFLYQNAYYHMVEIPAHNKLMHKYFPNAPDIYDLIYTTPLVLLNSHISINKPLPLVPNAIEIGGFHVSEPKKLSTDLQNYLDEAKEGVVYFSMGSNLQSNEIPIEKRNSILKSLSKLKMKVLWKFEVDLPGKPDNVKIGKWLPQQDILAHPNVKLFITHGGLLSTTEAIYHGVPVIGIPIFGDQAVNMFQAVEAGFAVLLEYSSLTEESFSAALQEAVSNKKYAESAKLRSQIMHDQPIKPLDNAVYWVEYVMKYKGAPHLRSPAMDLTWYQYTSLDVIGFVVLISVGFSCILSIFINAMCCKKNVKKNNISNKSDNVKKQV